MRSALVTLLLLAAGGLPTPHANAQSDASLDHEGAVMPFAAGDRFSWRIPADQFGVVLSAFDHGADVDLSQARVNYGNQAHLGPKQVSGYHFSYATGDVRSLTILNGTGLIAVVRNELMSNVPLHGAPAYLSANVSVPPGECRIQAYVTVEMKEPALLRGTGHGVRFRTYSSNLSLEAEAAEELNETVDPQQTRTEYMQACDPSFENMASARVEGIYPKPTPAATRAESHRVLSFGGAAAALLSVVVAFYLRRRE